jgi:two-component system chemotaxis sensor kinase CheA
MTRDPYKYFRIEARELLEGLGQGVLELEAGRALQDTVNRMLRLAHTLKGAARVVKLPAIAEAAHSLETLLARHREQTGPVGTAAVGELLALIDAASAQLSALGAAAPQPSPIEAAAAVPRPAQPPSPARRTETPQPPLAGPAALAIAETVRIEISDMDALLQGVSESSVQVSSLRRTATALGRSQLLAGALAEQLRSAGATHRREGPEAGLAHNLALLQELAESLDRGQGELLAGIESAERELLQLREHAGALRLVAARTLFAPLARAVRDAAQTLSKDVVFETRGGDARLEAQVLAALRDALLHVVRNAVAHGIESPADRAAAGKPPTGRIELEVRRRGGSVSFLCTDDGRGIDVGAVGRAAQARGLLSPSEADALGPGAAAGLIFEPGVSTSPVLNQVAGRGVGLDVVRETVARLRGEIQVRSEPGLGTTLELSVPISLSSLSALGLKVGGLQAWIALDAVVRTRRVTQAEIAHSSRGDALLEDGTALPFLSLPQALGQQGAAAAGARSWSVVVVRAGERSAAVGADRLLGVSSVIVRPIPRAAGGCALVSGATLDAEGAPQLVLDPHGLVAAAMTARGTAAALPARRRPILVVDDSLTTRMLEQSILETAGYEVDLAASAEEGLRKARDRRYGLFLVDVEMPGMNGFEFVAHTKTEPELREIPAILVTSLDSPEHRRRGLEAGARAYMAKGAFDEGRLRELIRELME